MPDPPGGTVALFSCSKGQISHESETFRRGFLMHFVIDGLSGKAANARTGEISWDKLVAHVKDEVPVAVTAEKGPKANQLPESLGRASVLSLGRALLMEAWPGRVEYAAALKVLYGLGRAVDVRGGIGAMKLAADLGNPLAQLEYARALRDGQFAAKDGAAAARLAESAFPAVLAAARQWAARDDPGENSFGALVMDNAGLGYGQGLGVAKDESEAAAWYRRAAGQGNVFALTNLAMAHLKGAGAPQDAAEAYRLAVRAAAAEPHPPVTDALLGILTAEGRGTKADPAAAVALLRKAAAASEPVAQAYLAAALATGRLGLARDDAAALKLLRPSAAQGNAEGRYGLGRFHSEGRGGAAQDAPEAAKWFRLAAEQGYAEAQFSLGVMLARGAGVPADKPEGLRWLRKAAAQGSAEAKAALEELNK